MVKKDVLDEQTQTWDWRRHNDFSTGELKGSRNKKIKRERQREHEMKGIVEIERRQSSLYLSIGSSVA
jgi:hypothetical protein